MNQVEAARESAPAGPLLGRDSEILSLRRLLKHADVRMLTLTGAAGIGKTRLALAAAAASAAQFAQTFFVDLTPLKKAELVPEAIARAVGIREIGSLSFAVQLCEAIGSAKILLVIDNCEHVLKCKSELDILIGSCPNLKVLATSRELFRSKWELVFPVGPLALPKTRDLADPGRLSCVPSVALFVQQVQNRLPDFVLSEQNAAVVAELCARLDGIPLAIQLAAGHADIQDLAETLTLLSREPAAGGIASGRHGTLSAALDWSVSLLSRQEAALFRRLSVFQGPWTMQEAVGVCAGEGLSGEDIPAFLSRLADASLVQVNLQAGHGKYYRFLETVRTYAFAKLRYSGEETAIRRNHRDWFLMWAEAGEPAIWGPEAPEFLERLELNYRDLWAAMEWCRDTPGEASCGLRLWASVVSCYDLRGRASEGIAMAERLLSQTNEHTPARARTLLQAGVLLRSQGDLDGARSVVTACRAFASALGDTFDSIAALCTLGSLSHIQGNLTEAEAMLHKACALARNCFESEPRVLYVSLFWLGSFCCFQGRHKQAVTTLEQALRAAREQGCILFEARILAILGRALVGTGDYARAESVLTEGIFTAGKLKYHEISALCLDYLGLAAWAKQQRPRAIRLLAAARLLRKHVCVVCWFPDRDYARLSSEISSAELEKAVPPDCLLPEQVTSWALEILGVRAGTAPDRESGKLTLREREVCRLVARGLGNRGIAENLQVSRRTVDAHIRHILVKLDLNTRAQISAWYTQHCGASQ